MNKILLLMFTTILILVLGKVFLYDLFSIEYIIQEQTQELALPFERPASLEYLKQKGII